MSLKPPNRAKPLQSLVARLKEFVNEILRLGALRVWCLSRKVKQGVYA